MPKLPVVSGEEAIKAFEADGFLQARQRGSHVAMKKEGHPRIVTVPLHKELKDGTLRKAIRDAGMSVERFCELL
jgi:predicted RNA binding protein YcfA (HicA-like mRNA interferase family)